MNGPIHALSLLFAVRACAMRGVVVLVEFRFTRQGAATAQYVTYPLR